MEDLSCKPGGRTVGPLAGTGCPTGNTTLCSQLINAFTGCVCVLNASTGCVVTDSPRNDQCWSAYNQTNWGLCEQPEKAVKIRNVKIFDVYLILSKISMF